MEPEEQLPEKFPTEIIVNLIRQRENLTAVELRVLKRTILAALNHDPSDQSFRNN